MITNSDNYYHSHNWTCSLTNYYYFGLSFDRWYDLEIILGIKPLHRNRIKLHDQSFARSVEHFEVSCQCTNDNIMFYYSVKSRSELLIWVLCSKSICWNKGMVHVISGCYLRSSCVDVDSRTHHEGARECDVRAQTSPNCIILFQCWQEMCFVKYGLPLSIIFFICKLCKKYFFDWPHEGYVFSVCVAFF